MALKLAQEVLLMYYPEYITHPILPPQLIEYCIEFLIEIEEDIHDNGQLCSRIGYFDGKEYGEYTEWYENGMKMAKGTFVEGQLVGVNQEWYENGQLRSYSVDGKDTKHWYSNCQLYCIGTGPYVYDYKIWHDNGQIACISRGPSQSTFTEWDENGRKLEGKTRTFCCP